MRVTHVSSSNLAMPHRDKSTLGDYDSAYLRELLLMTHRGTSSTQTSVQSQTLKVDDGSVAAALAVLPSKDDAPRVIQQFTSVFLVSRLGELWRVYDCDDPDRGERQMPSAQSTRSHRVFVALARQTQMRVFAFDGIDAKDIDPVSLQGQLDASITR